MIALQSKLLFTNMVIIYLVGAGVEKFFFSHPVNQLIQDTIVEYEPTCALSLGNVYFVDFTFFALIFLCVKEI
jgi:hypothetical protein